MARAHTPPPALTPVHIVNVGYRSTNFWVISAGRARLLVDIGWPGSMGQMRANLGRMDIPLAEIRYALATHYHIDHAGLGQEFKEAGVPLLVVDVQVDAIPAMQRWTKPQDTYTPITPEGNVVISCAQSRDVLAEVGIAGQILPTPGHSPDSVSLLLDDGSAFIGDLTWPGFIGPEDGDLVRASWVRLGEAGATRIYPGHGPVRPLPDLG